MSTLVMCTLGSLISENFPILCSSGVARCISGASGAPPGGSIQNGDLTHSSALSMYLLFSFDIRERHGNRAVQVLGHF